MNRAVMRTGCLLVDICMSLRECILWRGVAALQTGAYLAKGRAA